MIHSGQNKVYNKLDEQFLVMQDLINFNDKKMKKRYSEFTNMKSDITKTKTMFKHMMVQNQHSSPVNMDSPKYQDPDTVVSTNKKYSPLEGGNSTKHCDMWTLKHEISSPKFYELLVKTEIKGDTSMYLKSL